MSTQDLIRRESPALTGTHTYSVPYTHNLQISLANPVTVTGGSLVISAKTTPDSAFEALSAGGDTIDCSAPNTITIAGNRVCEIQVVSTATGTASAYLLDIRAWDE